MSVAIVFVSVAPAARFSFSFSTVAKVVAAFLAGALARLGHCSLGKNNMRQKVDLSRMEDSSVRFWLCFCDL
jgi:hypothetical protein